MKAPIGFTLIFHVAIIVLSAFKARLRKNRPIRIRHLRRAKRTATRTTHAVSLLIQFVIFASLLSIGVYGVSYAINDHDSTVTFLKHHHYGMRAYQPTLIEPDQRSIILRIDDVQAQSWSDISMQMIEDATQRDMKLSLGIIPHGLENDHDLTLFLKKHRSHLEFALHGWGEGDPEYEFVALSTEEADHKISRALNDLRALTKRPPATFIPPNNIYSEGTYQALVEHGFTIISSRGEGFFDYTAKTYEFEKKILIPNDEVLFDCMRGLDEKNLCVIMIHPQDYARGSRIDEEKYALYIDLLERLSDLDARFVTFEDYAHTFEHHEGFVTPASSVRPEATISLVETDEIALTVRS
jgi:hypothetical protein